jgi:hypothetical protein
VSLAIDQLNCNEFVQIARNSDKWRQTERRKQKINLPLIFFDAYPHVVIYFLLNFSTIGGTWDENHYENRSGWNYWAQFQIPLISTLSHRWSSAFTGITLECIHFEGVYWSLMSRILTIQSRFFGIYVYFRYHAICYFRVTTIFFRQTVQNSIVILHWKI